MLMSDILDDFVQDCTNYIINFIELELINLIMMGCECGTTSLDDFTVCYEEPCKFLYILCNNCGKKHYIKEVTDFQEQIGM